MKQFKKILVTGSPGTGKSTVGKKLAEDLDMDFTEANDIVKEDKLYTGKEKDSLVVDLEELEKELEEAEGVIAGGILCDISLEVDFVFVLRTNPKELRGRLEEKDWEEEKIGENLEAEAVDYCVVHSIDNYGEEKVFEVNTTSEDIEDVVEEIKDVLEGKTGEKQHFDWSDFF